VALGDEHKMLEQRSDRNEPAGHDHSRLVEWQRDGGLLCRWIVEDEHEHAGQRVLNGVDWDDGSGDRHRARTVLAGSAGGRIGQ